MAAFTEPSRVPIHSPTTGTSFWTTGRVSTTGTGAGAGSLWPHPGCSATIPTIRSARVPARAVVPFRRLVIFVLGRVYSIRTPSHKPERGSPFRRAPLGLRGQAEKVVDEVPGLLGLQIVGERRHGRSVQPGHQDPIEIGRRLARLVMPGREIRRRDGVPPIVLEILRGLAVSPTGLAMAARASEVLVLYRPPLDRIGAVPWLGGDRERHRRRFFPPSRAEELNVRDDVPSGARPDDEPGGHHRPIDSSLEGAVDVFDGGQGPGGRRAKFEGSLPEVPRPGSQLVGGIPGPVSVPAVTGNAVPLIDQLPIPRIPGPRFGPERCDRNRQEEQNHRRTDPSHRSSSQNATSTPRKTLSIRSSRPPAAVPLICSFEYSACRAYSER